jgi:signal transduction histidine kinase
MKRMIDDLLAFARTGLGDALRVSLATQEIGRICSDAIEDGLALYPEAAVDLRCTGDLAGRWDGGRIGQLLVNLLSNAIRYGSGPVGVEAIGADGQITLVVSNEGDPIPPNALPTLFDPLTGVNLSAGRDGIVAGMALGLYICRCIARAHNGSITVGSAGHVTTFTVQLPRLPS